MTWLSIWRWILDLSWLFVLLILLRYFWQSRKSLAAAQAWLKTKGHITSCEWSTIGHSVWPKIEYSYQVYDRDLVGHYLFLDTIHNNPNSKYARQIAYKVAVAFKENNEIDVYYNPNHPEQSALDVAMPKKLNFILMLIGILILCQVGVIIWHLLV
ncbi:MAG: DUF3592 domain-containing protein [Legionella sp.]|uniref:DUF3592 domain-containing protein n=1 Tax=Legionella sp. TaxID=459 RepID=UPI0039E28CE7